MCGWNYQPMICVAGIIIRQYVRLQLLKEKMCDWNYEQARCVAGIIDRQDVAHI